MGGLKFDEGRVMKNALCPFKGIQSFTVDFCADIIIGVVSKDNKHVV